MNVANLHRGLKSHYINKPNETAVIYYDQELTYKEIYERVNALANGLLSLGIKKGDRILINMRTAVDLIRTAVSYFGIVCQRNILGEIFELCFWEIRFDI